VADSYEKDNEPSGLIKEYLSNIASLCHRIQTDSGAHPASCPMGTGCKAVGA
jgi:hypothetical protein